jgi:hypothetical protein
MTRIIVSRKIHVLLLDSETGGNDKAINIELYLISALRSKGYLLASQPFHIEHFSMTAL